jgi:periplasmic divalent cation tolerance protein
LRNEVRVVLVTAPADEAPGLARQLVDEGVAACVSLAPGLTSVYRWKGDVLEAAETLLLVKTTEARIDELQRRVVALHSYEVPEFLVVPVESGLDAYLGWVAAETARTV